MQDYKKTYAVNPRQAAIEWFDDARFGLFMHYGLYSLLGRHKWVQLREKIPVAEYAKLKDRFTAKNFDADFKSTNSPAKRDLVGELTEQCQKKGLGIYEG